MLNLSPLFFTSDESEKCLLGALDLREEDRLYIANAKNEVRSQLRSGIPRAFKNKGYPGEPPAPRFFTQGSWAYNTLNAPAKKPQQADVDDGCYLPLSFVAKTVRPSVAAAVFFALTEEVLTPLVKERGWKLITSKPTCVRIEIAAFAHIDVPLYAIPDDEFTKLAKTLELRYGFDSLEEALKRADQDVWTALPSNSVLLAHRELDWVESDPRPVKDWFLKEVSIRGEQLRRVVRYLKAFRDWKWPSGGPASILLMAAAAPLFENHDRRDDLALLEVVAGLPAKLRAGVNNPVEEAESLTARLGEEGVEEAAKAFQEFETMLRGAIHASNGSTACTWLIGQFGPRFPNRPDLAKVAAVAAAIASVPAAAGPSELVGRTKAG